MASLSLVWAAWLMWTKGLCAKLWKIQGAMWNTGSYVSTQIRFRYFGGDMWKKPAKPKFWGKARRPFSYALVAHLAEEGWEREVLVAHRLPQKGGEAEVSARPHSVLYGDLIFVLPPPWISLPDHLVVKFAGVFMVHRSVCAEQTICFGVTCVEDSIWGEGCLE